MNKIFWHEGMFLQPHHFEILEKNLENLKKDKYSFGVNFIRIDQNSLENNEINVEDFEVIFPNGEIVNSQNAIVFNKKLQDQKGSKTVYLGIKKLKPSENVEVAENLNSVKGDKRFIADLNGSNVKDLYAGDEIANIKFLKYAVHIFLEDEINNLNDFEILPVLKFNFDEKKEDKYIPPVVSYDKNELFQQKIEKMYALLSEKINKLEEYKLPFSFDYSSPRYMKFLNILQILSKYASDFYVIKEFKDIHPFEIYKILRELVAQLSVFTDRINFYGKAKNGNILLKNYNHYKLLEVFDSFEILLNEILDEIVMGPEFTISFSKEDNLFVAYLDDRVFEKKYSYYLMVKPQNKENFVSDFEKLAKISSKNRINVLIQRALRGVKIKNVRALEGMPLREDVFYFKIDTFDKEWQEIEKEKNIAVYFNNIEFIDLIVMKE